MWAYIEREGKKPCGEYAVVGGQLLAAISGFTWQKDPIESKNDKAESLALSAAAKSLGK